MEENKKNTTKDEAVVTAEIKTDEAKSDDVLVEEKVNFDVDDKSEKRDRKSRNEDMHDDEELPDDIKAKLEKNKIARAKKKQIKKKKKVARKVRSGVAYVKASYNNTIVTLSDKEGNVLSWASAGIAGFKGAKKATPYAAQIITKIACMKAREEYGLEEVKVLVKGVGTGRESAIRALNANRLNVTSIKDVTPIPHNGCRPKKPRRV